MARHLAAIAASIVLSLAPGPIHAQNGENPADNDPFAPAPSDTPPPASEETPPPAAPQESPPAEAHRPEPTGGGQNPAAGRAPDLLPHDGEPRLDDEGEPEDWAFRTWGGSSEAEGTVTKEGRNGEACYKISSDSPTDSGWVSTEIKVKPRTRYGFTGWLRSENVDAEDHAKGVAIGIAPLQIYAEGLRGTSDWKRVRGTFDSGERDSVQMVLVLGGNGKAGGTAWFSGLSLREEIEGEGSATGDKTPQVASSPPLAYRRPSMEDPIFNREALTLDRDQVVALAEDLALLVVDFPDHPEISRPDFQAQALGISLRLDPRNRNAVVANAQLDQGQKLKPSSGHPDLYQLWARLNVWAKCLHSPDATPDDKALGLYIGDLARRVRPGDGFASEFAKVHPGDLTSAWTRVLPPPPPPVQPESPADVAENTNKEPEPTPDAPEPEMDPSSGKEPETAGADEEQFKIPSKLPIETASLFAPVQTGSTESRAALRKVTLQFRDYEVRKTWEDGQEKERRSPLTNRGPTEIHFDQDWHGLRSVWNDRVSRYLDNRYDGWPQRGAIDVGIPFYTSNSGSTAALATAICFEAMARGLTLDPKVAAVGTWDDKQRLTTHSHLPGIIIGYGKDWPEILIVGPGSREPLEAVAATGLVSPFLTTQIIEVGSFGEAVAIATGQAPPGTKASLEAYRAIMALRGKMEPGALAQNRFVLDKLREITAANPSHLSSSLLLKASQNQAPLDFPGTIAVVSRLFRSLEQLSESDIEWVTSEEGAQAIELFNDRMREFKPRFDRGVDRIMPRLDDAIRALGESARLRDRTTGTAMNRIEAARQKMTVARQAIDLAAAAGR